MVLQEGDAIVSGQELLSKKKRMNRYEGDLK